MVRSRNSERGVGGDGENDRGRSAAWGLWGEKKAKESEEINREKRGGNLRCYRCGREGHSLRWCLYTRHALGYPLHPEQGLQPRGRPGGTHRSPERAPGGFRKSPLRELEGRRRSLGVLEQRVEAFY